MLASSLTRVEIDPVLLDWNAARTDSSIGPGRQHVSLTQPVPALIGPGRIPCMVPTSWATVHPIGARRCGGVMMRNRSLVRGSRCWRRSRWRRSMRRPKVEERLQLELPMESQISQASIRSARSHPPAAGCARGKSNAHRRRGSRVRGGEHAAQPGSVRS